MLTCSTRYRAAPPNESKNASLEIFASSLPQQHHEHHQHHCQHNIKTLSTSSLSIKLPTRVVSWVEHSPVSSLSFLTLYWPVIIELHYALDEMGGRIQAAKASLQHSHHQSARVAASALAVPSSTLEYWLKGRKHVWKRIKRHKSSQTQKSKSWKSGSFDYTEWVSQLHYRSCATWPFIYWGKK